MLNREEQWEKAREIAEMLYRYAADTTRGKSTKSNEVNTLLTDSPNERKFLKNLMPIMEGAEDKNAVLAIAELINRIPADNVPYLVLLIRLHYQSLQK